MIAFRITSSLPKSRPGCKFEQTFRHKDLTEDMIKSVLQMRKTQATDTISRTAVAVVMAVCAPKM